MKAYLNKFNTAIFPFIIIRILINKINQMIKMHLVIIVILILPSLNHSGIYFFTIYSLY